MSNIAYSDALGLGIEELGVLARNSFAASFLDEPSRAELIASVDRYQARTAGAA